MAPSEMEEMLSYMDCIGNPPIFSLDSGHSSATFPSMAIPSQTSMEFCNNSTSDEAEDNQAAGGLIDERKRRRMLSNRESARRSRMRKKRRLDELWSQVVLLRTENHGLVDKLRDMSNSHRSALQENVRLKEEAGELRRMVIDLQDSNSFAIFKDLEEIT
ncbi:basic leucine zipper 43-like [Andrographis paniculata]|uniref:basic leucine zipper 43-like n=1 Tax=Andrographis paniculata TaxID=175694 RepID=UPI0021E79F24|nr:basic leucine zipper 43-like [Andrographis paniculata]XP_051149534.1 basic leucine zipper 43-like [Andrographis paniculata]XP_051149536.1 basic leucine zipper 43-like [Andrographis paniculata]